ncbi:MAG: phosphoribosylformylglycinamidine synthase subunit PurQ [Spirochaetales bacterium]
MVCVLTGYGINADRELVHAFSRAGATVASIHLARLFENPELLREYRIIAFPGGFSFGDHLGSGLALAGLVRARLAQALSRFVERGGLIIGICNGFQVLVKSGLLPDFAGTQTPEASLVHNDHGNFVDRWVSLRPGQAASTSPWLIGIPALRLPVRHGEGRFVLADPALRQAALKHTAFHYEESENPNGSFEDIAGVTDRTGRILGLMPHPEAAVDPLLDPHWRRRMPSDPAPAQRLFANGVAASR